MGAAHRPWRHHRGSKGNIWLDLIFHPCFDKTQNFPLVMNKTLFNFLGLSEVRHFGYHKGEVYLKNVKNDKGVIELRSQRNVTLFMIRKCCQRHNGPEGWVLLKKTYLDKIQTSYNVNISKSNNFNSFWVGMVNSQNQSQQHQWVSDGIKWSNSGLIEMSIVYNILTFIYDFTLMISKICSYRFFASVFLCDPLLISI